VSRGIKRRAGHLSTGKAKRGGGNANLGRGEVSDDCNVMGEKVASFRWELPSGKKKGIQITGSGGENKEIKNWESHFN